MNLILIILCYGVHAIGYVLAQREESRYGDNVPIFYSLRSVLDVFYTRPNAGRPDTQKILYAFENYCFSHFSKPLYKQRKPFIVVEGDHKTSIDIISRRLARRIGATLLQSVAKCLQPYKRVFPQGDPLRRAFYGLSMYAIAHKVKQVYNRYPVVTNGYWIEQSVFGIGNQFQTIEEIPPSGHPLYSWPDDLLKPDLIVYVTFPDNLHLTGTTRPPNAWKKRLEHIYRQILDPPVVILSTAPGFDNVTADIEEIVQERFAGKLDVNFVPNETI
uniref:Uncharacterized protein n=1 Tax=Homalodisca liturata TaxID=320908 RepID=A0A1B6J896_9HEMI